MNGKLMLYERSKNNIWTDSWISKNMLAAHLDLESDAASRNILTINKTVDWICQTCKDKTSLLDLGCGPGLYAEALSKKGYIVTGFDISKRSIDYAKEAALKKNLVIDYQHKNYITHEIDGKFDIIICIYCDFGALTPAEQKILLNKVHSSLNEDGILVFDVFSDGINKTKKENKQWSYNENEGFWSREAHFLLEETIHFPENHAWGTRSIVIETNKEIKEYSTWDTYYSKDGINELLRKNGFRIEEIKTDLIAENDFTSNDVLCIKAKKI